MKKFISTAIAAIMLAGCFAGCSNAGIKANAKKKIVTTIFPEYDWVMNILGDKASDMDVTMLLDNGVDLHSFQPKADDIMKISTCDLFIYVGGESDGWVDDALKESVNKDMVVINLLDALGDAVKEEEVVEGMQEEEHDHDHDHEEGEDHDHDNADPDEVEYDEHVWLSLHNSATLIEKISEAIVKIDPDNADAYKANASSYAGKVNELDKKYHDMVDSSSCKTMLFGDRFPFRYLADDYGLTYYAAFVGCSAETEASFETVSFLAKKVDELGLKAVLTIEGADHRLAETIIQNTKSHDQKVLSLDSMQSVTAADVKAGVSYLSIMENNLKVLTEALG